MRWLALVALAAGLLDRRTGRAVERLNLPNAPERITRQGKRLHVRTYDHDLVVQLANV